MIDRVLGWSLPIAIAAIAATLVALIGTTITDLGPWYQALRQPDWAPDNAVYGMAWTAIFALTALAAVTGWQSAPDREQANTLIGLFALNGFLNICWSLLFFRVQRPDWALFELIFLWLSIVVLIGWGVRWSNAARLLLLPYLAWVTFAGLLNLAVVRLNGPFG